MLPFSNKFYRQSSVKDQTYLYMRNNYFSPKKKNNNKKKQQHICGYLEDS